MRLRRSDLPPDREIERSPLPRQRALVVFEDRRDLSTLRLLRPGFRHCFCVLGSDLTWTICDPLKTRLEIRTFLGLTEGELAKHFHEHSNVVLVGEASADRSRRPLRLRDPDLRRGGQAGLNVDLPAVLTPFQLHRALIGLPLPLVPFTATHPEIPTRNRLTSDHK